VIEDRERHVQRLALMEGLIAAHDRSSEVLNLVSSAANAHEAKASLIALLELREAGPG